MSNKPNIPVVWEQKALNLYMKGQTLDNLATAEAQAKLYKEKLTDTGLSKQKEQELKEYLAKLTAYIVMANKAIVGLSMGKSFSESLLGKNLTADPKESWIVVRSICNSPVMQVAMASKELDGKEEWGIKPDGGWGRTFFFTLENAIKYTVACIQMADVMEKSAYWAYNVRTGEESRMFLEDMPSKILEPS